MPVIAARKVLSRKLTTQTPTRGIADPQFFDQNRIAESSLRKIAPRFGVVIELLLIEDGDLLEYGGRVCGRSALLLEVDEALLEGQTVGQLDKTNQIAALAAAVAVEEIFAGVDIKRRVGFRMQRTESDELRAVADGSGDPILMPQIIEQRQALPEFFEALAHGGVLPLGPSVGGGRQHSQARMVGEEKFFSETQRPENLQNRSQPRQRPSFVIGRIAACQPVSHASECFAEKGKCRLRVVQPVGPAAECGRIGHTIRIFERRCCLFPGRMLHKASLQCMTTCQQTVVRVREREQREEGEGLPATGAETATDVNPVVMLIVGLLAAASVADDRIAFTNRASPQNDLVTVFGPVVFDLVRRGRKWDKQNRISLELCPPALTSQDLGRKRSSFLLKTQSN